MRQLRLAQLLAEGVDGTEAMLQAGWPIETASWLGPRARAYLAKGGIEVPQTIEARKLARSAPSRATPTGVVGDAPAQETADRLAEGEKASDEDDAAGSIQTNPSRSGRASAARRERGMRP